MKNQVHDYEYEQQILNSLTYCPCECCDGFWFFGFLVFWFFGFLVFD